MGACVFIWLPRGFSVVIFRVVKVVKLCFGHEGFLI